MPTRSTEGNQKSLPFDFRQSQQADVQVLACFSRCEEPFQFVIHSVSHLSQIRISPNSQRYEPKHRKTLLMPVYHKLTDSDVKKLSKSRYSPINLLLSFPRGDRSRKHGLPSMVSQAWSRKHGLPSMVSQAWSPLRLNQSTAQFLNTVVSFGWSDPQFLWYNAYRRPSGVSPHCQRRHGSRIDPIEEVE